MPVSVRFAHITDIHISDSHQSWGTIGTLAEALLARAVVEINAMPDLDFVVFGGDVLDRATSAEAGRFAVIMAALEKPWHFVPGNHDGFVDPNHPDALAPHEAVSLIDPRLSSPRPDAQRAYWSRTVGDGVQLIGLDLRLPDTWNGRIDAAQLGWLREELDAHRDGLVLLAVHHPLHPLTARDIEPWWSNFICDNGEEVEVVLDAHPNVRIVVTGHHHAQQIRRRGGRLHVATGPLGGYPCVYRTIRVMGEPGAWQAQVETHAPATEGELKQALDLLVELAVAARYNPDDPSAWAEVVEGGAAGRTFEGPLG